MNDRLKFEVSRLSDIELHDCIDNRQNYMPDTIEAALAELQTRGVELEQDELKVINEDIKALRDNVSGQTGTGGLFNQVYKNNVVTDPFAPEIYSRRAIYGFTLFMGALFGSIMLAINAGKIRNNRGVWTALLFGVLYTALQAFIVNIIHIGTSSGIFFGLIAAFFTETVLWPRVIGNETFYRAKPIWIPLVIAIILGTLIVVSVIATQGQA